MRLAALLITFYLLMLMSYTAYGPKDEDRSVAQSEADGGF